MREQRLKSKKNRSFAEVTYRGKNNERYVNGVRKELRFSMLNRNECYQLITTHVSYKLDDGDEVSGGAWVTEVVGPSKAGLHSSHEPFDEGSGYRFIDDWELLPDYEELASACRFRDGRENNPFGAPSELYPHLALMLSYCRAVLLRRHVCRLLLIPDDSIPIVSNPKSGVENAFEFTEKTLNFYFGQIRNQWP